MTGTPTIPGMGGFDGEPQPASPSPGPTTTLTPVAVARARSYAKTPQKAARALLLARQRAQDARQAGHPAEAQDWEEWGDALEALLTGRNSCRVCGRGLTDPESVRLGIGPDCRGKR